MICPLVQHQPSSLGEGSSSASAPYGEGAPRPLQHQCLSRGALVLFSIGVFAPRIGGKHPLLQFFASRIGGKHQCLCPTDRREVFSSSVSQASSPEEKGAFLKQFYVRDHMFSLFIVSVVWHKFWARRSRKIFSVLRVSNCDVASGERLNLRIKSSSRQGKCVSRAEADFPCRDKSCFDFREMCLICCRFSHVMKCVSSTVSYHPTKNVSIFM